MSKKSHFPIRFGLDSKSLRLRPLVIAIPSDGLSLRKCFIIIRIRVAYIARRRAESGVESSSMMTVDEFFHLATCSRKETNDRVLKYALACWWLFRETEMSLFAQHNVFWRYARRRDGPLSRINRMLGGKIDEFVDWGGRLIQRAFHPII